jgi:hypothetical protein
MRSSDLFVLSFLAFAYPDCKCDVYFIALNQTHNTSARNDEKSAVRLLGKKVEQFLMN